MSPLIIWSIVILIIFFVIMMPIRFYFEYDDGNVTNHFSIYNIYVKYKSKKRGKNKEVDKKNIEKSSPLKIIKTTQKNYSEIMSLVNKIVRKILKSFVVERLRVNIIESTGDSAATAISFGYLTWIVNWFCALLDKMLNVKYMQVNINPDFSEQIKKIYFQFIVRIRLISIISILFIFLVNYKKVRSIIKKYKEDYNGSI